MKYELMVLEDMRDGCRDLYLKHVVFVKFASVPWEKGGRSKIWLNPHNINEVPPHLVGVHEILEEIKMPVLTHEELNILLGTVAKAASEVQSQNKKRLDD